MPRLWVPRKAGKQRKPPLGATVNWGHPIVRGLRGGWVFNEGSGLRAADITLRGSNGVIGSTVNRTRDGLYFDSTTTTDKVTVTHNAVVNVTGNITVVVGESHVDAGAQNYGSLFEKGPYNNNGYSALMLGEDDRFGWSTGTGIPLDCGETVSINKYEVLGFVHDGANQRFYVDGVQRASAVSIATPDSTTNDLIIGNCVDGSLAWGGTIFFMYLFARALSAGEMLQLYAEPYCFLSVPTHKTYFVAGGAPAQSQSPRTMHQFRLRRSV